MIDGPSQPPSPAWKESVREQLAALSACQRYLVGVSGGLDSCVLLHLLLEFGFRNLVVCHFDHRLRGSESDRDLALVRRTAELRGLAFQYGTATDWLGRG